MLLPRPSKSIRTIWTPLKTNFLFRIEQPRVDGQSGKDALNSSFFESVLSIWRAIKFIKVDSPVPTFPSQPITQMGRFGLRKLVN